MERAICYPPNNKESTIAISNFPQDEQPIVDSDDEEDSFGDCSGASQ